MGDYVKMTNYLPQDEIKVREKLSKILDDVKILNKEFEEINILIQADSPYSVLNIQDCIDYQFKFSRLIDNLTNGVSGITYQIKNMLK